MLTLLGLMLVALAAGQSADKVRNDRSFCRTREEKLVC